ncbi:MAG: aa3-type cytochrome c oxidase subunit IV [Pseudomonadota bacterium]
MASNFDMRQSEETWKTFTHLAVWVLGLCAVTMILMAIFLT